MEESELHDVCLILEGSYPFVTGGVSSWMHNLVSSLPDINFTAICILATSKEKNEYKYKLPKNISGIKVVYLHDHDIKIEKGAGKSKRVKDVDAIRAFHYKMINKNDYSGINPILPMFDRSNKERPTTHDMIFGKEAWNLVLDLYNSHNSDASFIDYFWTYRFNHLPIFNLLNAEIPKAKLYHAISTGFAGLLGVLAKHKHKRPLILTEHGIYTKERKIEIAQAEWIYVAGNDRIKVKKDLGTFQNVWIRMFDAMGKFTYREAERIYTIYEGNRKQEIIDGADPEKTFLIPNGINIEKFGSLEFNKECADKFGYDPEKRAIGFVGRIVPIKDVKTFIRACKIISLRLPNIKVYIIGPTDEDGKYFKECRDLTNALNLNDVIEYTGKVKVDEFYPMLDLVVLTSISEAQPLVILEANCAGIPVVATDVGACRELLEGITVEDNALGASGIVSRVADPAGAAEAAIKILSDSGLKNSMSEAGKKRVAAFYRESDLNSRYLSIYKEMAGAN